MKEDLIKKLAEKKINVETVYSCGHCQHPTGYDSIDAVEEHQSHCALNVENKSCAMCKYLTIYEDAPYPKNAVNTNDPNYLWVFGRYRKPFCEYKAKYLSVEDVYDSADHESCFEYSNELPKIRHTAQYTKWQELVEQAEKETKELEKEYEGTDIKVTGA